MSKSSGNPRTPTLTEALIPVGALVVFLAGSVLNLNELPTLVVITPLLSALASVPLVGGVLYESIPVQIPLAAATVVAAIMAGRLGANWREIQQGMVNGIMHSLGSILILLAVGMLIGVWIASGVVPMLITWGLQLMSPSYFLSRFRWLLGRLSRGLILVIKCRHCRRRRIWRPEWWGWIYLIISGI